MKRALNIAPGCDLPLDAITQTFALLAVRGAGKTNTAAVMAEEMYTARLPFVVIDPVGSWYGLRARADGSKGEGLAIPIFGGRHGDAPLERTGGQLLADLVVDQRLTCVLDVSELSEGDKIRFLIDFAERLYRRNTQPLHLFLEEADDYAPQRPMREQARLLGAWQNIVRRGRSRGLGITMITQRSAVLNKDVLTQIETLFVMRTTSPQDRKAIEAWVALQGGAADMLKTLPALESGEAWIWSPSWLQTFKRVRVRRRWTFDSGATPKSGSSSKPATLADVDLGAIRAAMAETLERAKLEDPKALRAELARRETRIGELQRQLEAKAKPTEKRVEVSVLTAKDRAELERMAKRLEAAADKGVRAADSVRAAAAELEDKVREPVRAANGLAGVLRAALAAPVQVEGQGKRLSSTRPQTSEPERPTAGKPVVEAVRRTPSTSSSSNGHTSLGNSGLRRILVALVQAGKPLTPSQIAIRTSIARRGGTFRTYVGKLITDGLAARAGDRLVATTEGQRALGDQVEALPMGRELLEHWLGELGSSGASRMLRAVADAYPLCLTREELAAATEIAIGGGTFRTYLGKLKTLELVRELDGKLELGEDLA